MKRKEYDLVVVGGGIAGVAASVAAAQRGAKTALIEKTILPGGLATSGLVYFYLPLCDGSGTMVAKGLVNKLLQKSLKYGPGDINPEWSKRNSQNRTPQRYMCTFSPASFVLGLDEILEESGVDVWLDTLFCSSNVSNDQIKSVEVENKSGRIEISAKTFIDASGDCDLARRSGVATNSTNNALTLWHMEYNKLSPDSGGDYFAPRIQVVRKGQIPSDQNKKIIPADQIYHGLSGSTVSDFILRGRKELRQRYQKIYSENRLNRQNCFAVNLPLMAQLRKTYCIRGTYTLTSDDWGKHFSDSIGLIADWRIDDRVWEIPYSSLLCPEISNLLTVGRCCSAVDDAWEITRVIPAAALTGEAAGVAAFCASSSSKTVKNLDLKILQENLKQGGTPLHLPELNLNYKKQ